MKKYKKELFKGFEERRYELIELYDGDSLPWWMEEKWILGSSKVGSRNDRLIVNFLVDKNWERGSKIVDEVVVTTSEMANNGDYSSKIIELDMRKENFEGKIERFWIAFDK